MVHDEMNILQKAVEHRAGRSHILKVVLHMYEACFHKQSLNISYQECALGGKRIDQ